MKKLLILFTTLLAAGSLAAQDAKQTDRSVQTTLPPPIVISKPAAAGSIAGHKVVYNGIAVQLLKSKQPLEMINPLAPPEYGSGSRNLDRDIITGKPTGGFKIFSINF